ncbi:MAG: hypothetical protein JWP97_5458 [Labilithrix sp.]|nr:hypothetical protein [Labilithrix sp.]
MTMLSRVTPWRAAQLFAASNVAFLGVDIALAHLANDFARRAEWAPLYFSFAATLLLLPGALGFADRLAPTLDRIAGYGSIAVGTVGMIYHLQSGFFAAQTLHDLVYSAPFVAPVAYVGVGLLIVLLRSAEASQPTFGPWLIVLALGGFIGNFALSLLDHAQNGFFHVTEWIPVASAAFAIGFLVVALASPGAIPLRVQLVVMAMQVAVGMAGFVLHVLADVHRPAAAVVDRFVFGAPAFAPMLFADLATLGAIGLWASRGHDGPARRGRA